MVIAGKQPAALRTALAARTQAMKAASDTLRDVLILGNPVWSIAAAWRLGALYETFVDALHAAPPPSGLSPDDVSTYLEQLDAVSAPLHDRAVEAYRIAYQKGLELALFTPPLFAARAALIRLGALPPEREARAEVRFEDVPDIQLVDWLEPTTTP
jgi:hypothetical protein